MRLQGYTRIFVLVLIIITTTLMVNFQATSGIEIEELILEVDNQEINAIFAKPDGNWDEEALPGVVVFHGFSASKEMMRPFIEGLSQNGFGVLAVDQFGHGLSSGSIGENLDSKLEIQGTELVEIFKNFDEIDPDRIGLLGHSMGGSTVIQTATNLTDIKSAVVIGNSLTNLDELNIIPSLTVPQNLLMIMGRFDELFSVDDAKSTMKLFTDRETIEPGQMYGSFETGTGRMLLVPRTNHIFEVLNTDTIESSINWIYNSLVIGQNEVNVVEYNDPNGFDHIVHQFTSFIAGLAWIALIPILLAYKTSNNEIEDGEIDWLSHGSISIAAFSTGVLFLLLFPNLLVMIFLGWYLFGLIFYLLRIKYRDKKSYSTIIKQIKDNIDWKDTIYASSLFLILIISIHILLYFVQWDFRYVLPILVVLDIKRFLMLFLPLFFMGILFFTMELYSLGGTNKNNLKELIKEIIARAWGYFLILIVYYIPIFVFEEIIFPPRIGFISFFILGFIPALIIISIISWSGRRYNYSPFPLAIINSGMIAWVLAATLPFI